MAAGRWRVHQSKFHRAGVLNVLPHSVSVAPACIHSEKFNAKCRKQHLASAQSRLGAIITTTVQGGAGKVHRVLCRRLQ